ncbi:hypothetical protein E8E11_001796 [Didymella keratinophila]|nr:hypothetical protein E8E11_001796 [Didymella keratinophila]
MPNILDEVDAHVSLYMRTRFEVDTGHGLYAPILQEALLLLRNIEQISYVWDGEILPQRYKEVWLLGHDVLKQTPSGEHAAVGVHIGFLVNIKAHAAARFQPKLLNLAIELQRTNAFIVHATTEDLSTVSEKVETLILKDSYYPFDSGAPEDIVTPVTRTMFLSLRSLTIDHNGFQYWYNITDIDPNDTPELQHLAIIDGGQHFHMINSGVSENYTIQLLRCYGQRLRLFELIMINSDSQGHDHFNGILTRLNLKILSINEHHKQFQKSTSSHAST